MRQAYDYWQDQPGNSPRKRQDRGVGTTPRPHSFCKLTSLKQLSAKQQSDNKRLCPSVDERNANKRVRAVARRTKSAQTQQESLVNRVREVNSLPSRSLTSAVLRREQVTSASNALQTRANKKPNRRQAPNGESTSYLLLSHIDQKPLGGHAMTLSPLAYANVQGGVRYTLVP